MTKPMSALSYGLHAEGVRVKRPTEIVTLKSGSVFELRRPDLQAWVMTGRVPQSLMEEGMKAWRAQGKTPDAIKTNNPHVITDAAIFALTVVQECTVNPKLVEFPDPKKNEIGPQTMLEEDFNEIFEWAMTGQGVAGLNGLRTFRKGRERRTSPAGSHTKKQRRKGKSVIESGSMVS